MSTYRYFKWDGTEPFAFDKEKLMDELSQRLMADGNLTEALMADAKLPDAGFPQPADAVLERNAAPLEGKTPKPAQPL